MQVVGFVRTLFEIYSVIMLIRVLSSWFQVDPYSPVMRLLYQVTEPVLAPIRRTLNSVPQTGGMDFSPMVALILLQVLESIVTSALIGR